MPARAGVVVLNLAAVAVADLEPLTVLRGAPPLGPFLVGMGAGVASKAIGEHLWQPVVRVGPIAVMGFSVVHMTWLVPLAAAVVAAITVAAEAAGMLVVGAEVGAPT